MTTTETDLFVMTTAYDVDGEPLTVEEITEHLAYLARELGEEAPHLWLTGRGLVRTDTDEVVAVEYDGGEE